MKRNVKWSQKDSDLVETYFQSEIMALASVPAADCEKFRIGK